MSLDDLFKRYIWTSLQMMKAPIGSTERMEWLRILDDLKAEEAVARTTTNSDNFDLDWGLTG